MKTLKSLKLSGINIAIYAFLLCLALSALAFIWKFTNETYLRPENLKHHNLLIVNPSNNVFVYLYEEVIKNNDALNKKLQRNVLIYDTIKRIVTITLLFLLTIQLKTLINSLTNQTLFVQKNLVCVKKISYLLAIWVTVNFILYQCFQFFIPYDLIQHNYGYIPINRNILSSLLLSIDYIKLLAALAFYIISIAFKEGYQLKEQSDLTI